MKHKHLMIDIETLDTVETAVILSIAAVRFDLETGELDKDNMFYRKLSIQDGIDNGRTISEDTLKWWLKQEPSVRNEAFEGGEFLQDVLMDLYLFLYESNNTGCNVVWANSPAFDFNIIKHSFRTFRFDEMPAIKMLTWPFKYCDERDVRTYLADMPNVWIGIENMAAHSALDDCFYQIKCVCAVHEAKTRAFSLLGVVNEVEQ